MARFPDVELADRDGLLCISEFVDEALLVEAYQSGIFPWPVREDLPITWFAPPERFLLYTKNFKMPKSLAKKIRKSNYTFSVNQNFEKVMQLCIDTREDTWITPKLVDAYVSLFRSKKAYCIETYREGSLAGGLYGVTINGFVSGESMFHLEDDGSKVSVAYLFSLLEELKIGFCDCQVETPLLKTFGARPVSRASFTKELSRALAQRPSLGELKKSGEVLDI